MPEDLPWWAQLLFLVFATTVAVGHQWYESIQKKEMQNQLYGRHAQQPVDMGYFPTGST